MFLSPSQQLIGLHLAGLSLYHLELWLPAHHPPHSLLARSDSFYAHAGIPQNMATRLKKPSLAAIENAQQWAKAPHHHLVFWSDNDYPTSFHHCQHPPLMLFVQGNPDYLHKPQCAVVGSRNASAYGMKQAYTLSAGLSQRGFIITSGLALGIDGQAHQAAIDYRQPSIAVLGLPIDCIHPKRHERIYHQLSDHGCLISEVALGTAYHAGLFPQRNRLLAALASGILVIEATIHSGALITARHGLDQGKIIMALPGQVQYPQAHGCHQLIQDGAYLVTNVEDIDQLLSSEIDTS